MTKPTIANNIGAVKKTIEQKDHVTNMTTNNVSQSKKDKLQELRDLYSESLITEEDYEAAKKKIIDID